MFSNACPCHAACLRYPGIICSNPGMSWLVPVCLSRLYTCTCRTEDVHNNACHAVCLVYPGTICSNPEMSWVVPVCLSRLTMFMTMRVMQLVWYIPGQSVAILDIT